MRHQKARTNALSLAVILGMGLPWLAAAPAHAAVAYTWTGGHGSAWSDPRNWAPNGVPGDGDSVTVTAIPGRGSVAVDQVPAVSLKDLTVSGTDDSYVHFGGDDTTPVSVTGTFTWTGGRVDTEVTLAAGAQGTISGTQEKALWGDLITDGTLTMSATTVAISWGHDFRTGPTGTMNVTGASTITTDRCCGDPDKLVNDGTLAVDGSLTTSGLELDQQGLLTVTSGSTVTSSHGLARLGPDATYDGAGGLSFEHTSAPTPDPDHPDSSQGAVLVHPGNTFAHGFSLTLGTGAIMQGSGSIDGTGAVTMTGATSYADLGLGSGIALDVTGNDASQLSWSDLPGLRGRLKVAGSAQVDPGSRLNIRSRTRLMLARGGTLRVPSGAIVGSDTCCVSIGSLVVSSGGSVTLGGGLVTWVDVTLAGGTLSGHGTIDRALRNTSGLTHPTGGTLAVGGYVQGHHGVLRIDVHGAHAKRLAVGGKAKLRGTLLLKGKAGSKGTTATVLSCKTRAKTFSRVKGSDWRLAYTAKKVAAVAR